MRSLTRHVAIVAVGSVVLAGAAVGTAQGGDTARQRVNTRSGLVACVV